MRAASRVGRRRCPSGVGPRAWGFGLGEARTQVGAAQREPCEHCSRSRGPRGSGLGVGAAEFECV